MATKKRKLTKPRKVAKTPKTIKSPEELEHIWDEDTQEAWGNLNQNRRAFLVAFMTNGTNGSQAYRKVYNPSANDSVASSGASQIMTNSDILVFIDKLLNNSKIEMFKAKKVYLEGMEAFKPIFGKDSDGQPEKIEDLPDHKIRRECADSLMKLNGELTDRTENNLTINKTLTINGAVLGEMNQFLGKIGHTPIKQANGTPEPQQTIEPVIEDEEFESFGDSSMRVIGND